MVSEILDKYNMYFDLHDLIVFAINIFITITHPVNSKFQRHVHVNTERCFVEIGN